MAYDVEKLTKLKALKALAERMKGITDTIPTKVSDLVNDSKFQTETEVAAAIAAAGHASFQKADAVPEVASASDNVLYLVMNSQTAHYDIYAKVGGEVVLLDDTTVDLSGYVEKADGKGLSSNDYTDADKAKLAGLESYSTATSTKDGLMSASDKSKLDGITIATDAEVTEMLNDVFATS